MGIDPGTNVMGYGIIRGIGQKAEMIAMGVIDIAKSLTPIFVSATYMNVLPVS